MRSLRNITMQRNDSLGTGVEGGNGNDYLVTCLKILVDGDGVRY